MGVGGHQQKLQVPTDLVKAHQSRRWRTGNLFRACTEIGHLLCRKMYLENLESHLSEAFSVEEDLGRSECTGMARVVRKLELCFSVSTVLLFFLTFCLTMVAGLEWNVLKIPRPRPKSGDQRSVSEVAVVLNKSQNVTAHAKIIHRNSLSSPVRRINATRLELMHETILRDQARVTSIQKHITRMVSGAMVSSTHKAPHQEKQSMPAQDVETPVFSALTFGSGEYFAILGVGTPHRYMYLIIDTGSDITWLQCAPCENCYKQKNMVFNPSNSSTFKVLDCHADLCLNLDVMGCLSNRCLYQADYGDGSFTMGELATDNVALDAATGRGQVVLSNIPLGCGHDNEGFFGIAAGILGLGKGPLSFPNHVDSSSSMLRGSVFSYCLPDREGDSNQRSSLIFGDAAIPEHAADGVKFTPQLQNPHVATYYYLQITGVSVGGNLLTTIPPTAFQLDFHGNGGTIIDSGTTITRLNRMAYTAVRDAFRDATEHLNFVGELEVFDTCYDLSGMSSIKVPTVTFHFLGDVDMRLPPSNYIVPVDNDNKYCFAFVASEVGPSIIGNVQQQEFLIIYDNANRQIGFYPSQCTS